MNNQNFKSSGEHSYNYCEYSVERKNDTELILKKIGIVVVSLIIIGAVSLFIWNKIPQVLFIFAVCVFFGAAFLWRFVSIEYEYIIISGEFDMDVIYGSRSRKRLYSFKIKDAEIIAPYKTANKKAFEGKNIVYSLSSKNSDTAYYAVFRDLKGKPTVAVFDVTKKILDILKYYNHSTVIDQNIQL